MDLESLFLKTKQKVLLSMGKAEQASFVETPLMKEKFVQLEDYKVSVSKLIELLEALRQQTHDMLTTEQEIANYYYEYSVKEKQEIWKQMQTIGQAHRITSKQQSTFVKDLDSLIDSLKTFRDRALEDMFHSITKFDEIRMEYDGWVSRVKDDEDQTKKDKTLRAQQRFDQSQRTLAEKKEHYEKAKTDLFIKLDLLEEKRVGDLHKYVEGFIRASDNLFTKSSNQLEELEALHSETPL